MSLLIQLPNNASTSKYAKSFPQPLNLSAIQKDGDIVWDLALRCFKKKKSEIFEILESAIITLRTYPNIPIIINAGDYPADATYSEYYNFFFDKMVKSYTAMGMYPVIHRKKLEKRFQLMRIDKNRFLFPNYDFIQHGLYPKVNGKLKASIKVSFGCPRKCKMCPVPQYYWPKEYLYFDINDMAEEIQKLYDKGIRYFTFIDDNLSAHKDFVRLLENLRARKLKGIQFHCQEGFDMQFFDDRLAELLVDLNFDDIKIAFENIYPEVLKRIDKTHITTELITKTVKVIKDNSLNVKAFLLIGAGESYSQVLSNIEFFSMHGMTMRCNIIRNYNKDFLGTIEQKLSEKEMRELKALAYAASFWTSNFGINIFNSDSENLRKKGLVKSEDKIIGKTKYGFQTSRFEKGIEFMFNRKIIENTGKNITLEPEKNEPIKSKLAKRKIDGSKNNFDKPKDTGFTAKALKKSRDLRKEFLSRFGIDGRAPTSILKHDRKETLRKHTIDLSVSNRGGNYVHHYRKIANRIANSEDYTPGLDTTGMMTQGRTDYLSAFPQNVGRIITDLYCPDNGTVYDPFAGHNSRMQMVFRTGRNYIGCDVCHEFMKDNHKIKEILLQKMGESLQIVKYDNWIELHECSSDNVPLEDEIADFTITSPPYWDLEKYGPEEEQLGNAKTYEKFLELLGNHIKENYRVLKPGSFAVWNVNDFRKNKKFYPYHIDIYQKMLEAEFIPFNIYIIDLVANIGQMFIRDIIDHRFLPKKHEYLIIMRKEGPDWWEKTK